MLTRELLERALGFHRSGNWQEAESLYRQVIAQDPDQPDGWHLFGVLAHQLGDCKTAIDCISQAIILNSTNPDFHNNLGEALRLDRQWEAAIKSYQAALNLRPKYGEVWMNLGLVYQSLGNTKEAIVAYQNSISIQPKLWRALNNLGILFKQEQEYQQAIGVLERAIEINPNYANAYDNLGLVYQAQEKYDRAIYYHQAAIKLDPNDYAAYNNLGNAYQEKDNLDKAIECYLQSIKCNSNFTQAHLNLGNALGKQLKFDRAMESYQNAIRISPNSIEAITNLGNTYRDFGQIDQALNYYQQALEIDSNYPIALWNYYLMLPVVYRDISDIQMWRERFIEGLQKIITWAQTANQKQALQGLGCTTNFYLQYQGQNDRDLQQQFGNLSHQIMQINYPQWAKPRLNIKQEKKIKVGFISSFFKEHTIAKLFSGWIKHLDKQKFLTYGYFTGKKSDRVTQEIANNCVRFDHIFSSIESICDRIDQDQLDILIFTDVGMCPSVDKIAALKLAPIQCLAWGHPITSGLPTIDYFLSSELMEPIGAESHYSERLITLPGIGISYPKQKPPEQPKTRSFFGLADSDVVYLACQSLYKYLPQYDIVFPHIAKEVKRSKFVFIESVHSKEITQVFQTRLSNAFAQYDLNWQEHCHFVPRLDSDDYLSLNLISDIFLDSIEWSGGNTTLEAIGCELPIVTTPGQFMRGRHSYGMLTQMNIPETIGLDLNEYVNIAIRLGVDRDFYAQMKEKITISQSLLFNDHSSVRRLEELLVQWTDNGATVQ